MPALGRKWVRFTGLLLAFATACAFAQDSRKELSERVTRLERLVESQGLAELLARLEEMQQELQRLHGEIEVQAHTIEKLQNSQRTALKEFDERMKEMEQRVATAAPTSSTAAQADVSGPAPVGPPLPSASADAEAQQSAAPPDTETPVPAAPPGKDEGPATQPGEDENNPQATGPASEQEATPPSARAGSAEGPVESKEGPPESAQTTGQNEGSSEDGQKEGLSESAPVTDDQPIATAGPSASPETEQGAYESAFNLLKEGRYEKAGEAFRAFLNDYPSGSKAGNAQYWLGETYYVTRHFKEAAQAFQTLLDTYPASPKRPDAALKIGYTHYELGEWDEARRTLNEVISQYSDTTSAKLAEKRLQKMTDEGH